MSSEDDPAAKLQVYKQQLSQVEAAIEQDPTNREWTKLKADLLEVIQLTSELAQATHGPRHTLCPSAASHWRRLTADMLPNQ